MTTSSTYAQWEQTFCYRGDWDTWRPCLGRIYTNSTYSKIILKTSGGLEYFSFWIPDYQKPSKKELKEHRKSGEWFSYTGIVEYRINDNFPDAETIAKYSMFVIPNPRIDKAPTVKRSTRCTIRIAPYKKHPEVYNIWFDFIGVGISIRGLKFNFK